MTSAAIPVGLGEIKVARGADSVLVCYGLGSCIGLAAYDPEARAAGLAHVVLPNSNLSRGGDMPGKFADTAVPALLQELSRLGAARSRLICKIAGGAGLLRIGPGSRLDIGTRNIEAVKEALAKEGLGCTAEDVGGGHGRTVHLFIRDGRMTVGAVGQGEREL